MIFKKENLFVAATLLVWVLAPSAFAIEIVVDYTYDTEGFFTDPIRRTAIEAVASRYSRVITSEPLAVGPTLDGQPWRIGLQHPGTGESFQLSTAADQETDPLFDASGDVADLYGFPGLEENQWILFAGGRDLVSASGIGGSGTGLNFSQVFDDEQGPFHRGVFPNTPDDSLGDIPAWGGYISFGLEENWHFELDEVPANGTIDFYTIAMHEVGHALGLGTRWNQWEQQITDSGGFEGANAIAAYNADNGTDVTELALGPASDPHWEDGVYLSRIFQPGEPNLVGTVGDGLQDLLLEPIANFTSVKKRFELTNVEAAALVDIGWSVLEDTGDPLDLDGDGFVNPVDVDLACSNGDDMQPYFAALSTLSGDLDFDSTIGFSDFLILSSNFGLEGTYSSGDVNCNGEVGFDDFLVLSSVFGASSNIAPVPEPSGLVFGFAAMLGLGCGLRTRRSRD